MGVAVSVDCAVYLCIWRADFPNLLHSPISGFLLILWPTRVKLKIPFTQRTPLPLHEPHNYLRRTLTHSY